MHFIVCSLVRCVAMSVRAIGAEIAENLINTDMADITITVFYTDYVCGYPLVMVTLSLLIKLDIYFFSPLGKLAQ